MHICFLSNEYPLWSSGGGVGSFLQTFSRILISTHKITIIGIGETEEIQILNDKGITLIRLPKPKSRYFKFFENSKKINEKIREIHAEAPIDIVESAELGLAFIKKIKGVKYIIRLHGGHHFFSESENRDIHWRKGWMEKRSFSKADAFIAVSDYVKTHTSKYLSYGNKPIVTIKNLINTAVFQPLTGIISEPFNITFVGTVCEKKGVRQLIKAILLLKNDFPELKLNIYGRDWKYPNGDSYIEGLRNEFKTQIEDLVVFHGSVPITELPHVYAKAQICVFPSHMETQGLVAPEAMSMERPVIFTKLGPGPETVEHGKTGLLCDPHKPEDIAEKIRWIFLNKNDSIIIGKKAREFVLQNFDSEAIINKNVNFYHSLL